MRDSVLDRPKTPVYAVQSVEECAVCSIKGEELSERGFGSFAGQLEGQCHCPTPDLCIIW